jgi:hypothetical protein
MRKIILSLVIAGILVLAVGCYQSNTLPIKSSTITAEKLDDPNRLGIAYTIVFELDSSSDFNVNAKLSGETKKLCGFDIIQGSTPHKREDGKYESFIGYSSKSFTTKDVDTLIKNAKSEVIIEVTRTK